MSRYYAAVTRRSTSAEPKRHALSKYAEKAPGRTTVEAICGTQVARAVGDWDPTHPRACSICKQGGGR